MHRRVVITGLGCISAQGHQVATCWEALAAGRSAIGPLQDMPGTMPLKVPVAAQVRDFDPTAHFAKATLAPLDRFAQFALLAAREALQDSGLQAPLGHQAAVVLGSGIGGLTTLDEGFRRLYVEQIHRLNPLSVPRVMQSAPVSAVSMDLGISGPCFGVSSACASANHALLQALWLVRAGVVPVALAGGSEACLTPGVIKAWEALRVLAPDTCRPFSVDRRGLVLGEGAGVLLLEERGHALARGAKIYAEFLGGGMSADAGDIVQPSADGAARALHMALDDAGLTAPEVDYINAHGTGTGANDVTETRAIHQVFGGHAGRLAVSSTKSMHGHALGAAGGLEAVATVKALETGIIPPTANFTHADPACDLDYVPNQPRQQAIRTALSNAFAFGGLNAVLAFGRRE